jgi:hypothetical protein
MSQPPHGGDGSTQEGETARTPAASLKTKAGCFPVDAFAGRVAEKARRFAGNAESFLLKVLKLSRSGLLEGKTFRILAAYHVVIRSGW